MRKKPTARETAKKLADIMSEHLAEMASQEQQRRIKAGKEGSTMDVEMEYLRTGICLGVAHDKVRKRRGCDGCKKSIPTQQFRGFCGDVLWMCEPCLKKLQSWTQKAQPQKKKSVREKET